jgi:hypothetical protein
MKCWNKLFIATALFLLVIVSVHPCYAKSLREILQEAQAGGTYLPPGQEELNRAKDLFRQTFIFSGESLEALQKAWAELHFEIREIREGESDFLILSENRSHKTGRGFYLFPRLKPQQEMLLQLPHSFKDLHTGTIGLQLALEGTFTGVGWNTVPRYFTKNGRRVDADFSDLFDTYFAAFTTAFAQQYADGYVVQLHGYAQSKRTSPVGSRSDMILSTGVQIPALWLKEMDACLEQQFPAVISTYPLEVKELGATKTSIGIILRQIEHDGFLHVEMSKPMRLIMRDKPSYRGKFLNCLYEVLP